MRIALLQMRIDRASRAANLAHAVRLIDLACAAEPSPDLIVLPSGCDGTGAVKPVAITPAMSETFGQSIAAKAREWGVYVASGFGRFIGGECVVGAALFDPDGDAVVRCPDRRLPESADVGGPPSSTATTPFGRWHLALGGCPWEAVAAAGGNETALIIVPASRADAAENCAARQADALATAARASVCVVVEAGASPTGGTRIVGCDGTVVAALADGGEDILAAEVGGRSS